jgi:hypothetical protein
MSFVGAHRFDGVMTAGCQLEEVGARSTKMSSMRAHVTTTTLLSALAALILSACGSAGSTTTGVASAPTTTTTTTTVTTTPTTTQSPTTTTSATTSPTTTTSDQSAATTTAVAGSQSPCRAAGLGLSYLGGQGATGHGLLGFALRNTLSTSCTTYGYPGVLFLGKSGAPLPTSPTHTTNDFFGHSRLGDVVVDPGQTTSFRLGVTHGMTSTAGCTTAYGLQVIPPNDTATLRVLIPGGVLECGTATVSPMQPGTSAFH